MRGVEPDRGLRHLFTMRMRLLLVGFGTVTGLVLALILVWRGGGAPPQSPDGRLADPWPAPELTLTGPAGERVALRDFRGRHVAVFFGYTHCPDICPITLSRLARLRNRLDPGSQPLEIVFVTVDPVRDTPRRLAEWTGAFGPGVVPLRGSPQEVRQAAWRWGVGVHYRSRTTGATSDVPPDETDYLVDHTARTFIVDPRGQVVAQLTPEREEEALAGLLEELLR